MTSMNTPVPAITSCRGVWFFGLLALSFLLDFGDTLIKGKAYLHSLTAEYPVRNIAYILLCLVAMRVRSERFHAAFVIAAICLRGPLDLSALRPRLLNPQ